MLRPAEEPPPLDVWSWSGNTFTPLTKDGGYKTPVLCEDGALLALKGDQLLVLSPAKKTVPAGSASDPLDAILACRKGTAVVFTRGGALVKIALDSGTTTTASANVGPADRAMLWASTRTCGGKTVRERYLEGTKGYTELVVTKADSPDDDGEPITKSSPLKFHLAPAFSADCARVVFAGAPDAPAPPKVTPPPAKQGCDASAGAPSGVALAGMLVALLAFVRRRR